MPPLAFHGADADAGGADAEPLLPLRDERVEAALEFAALEAFEVPLDFGGIVRVAGVDDEAGWRFVGRGFDGGSSDPAGGGPHLQHVHCTKESVLLPRHVTQLRRGGWAAMRAWWRRIQSALAATNSAICALPTCAAAPTPSRGRQAGGCAG